MKPVGAARFTPKKWVMAELLEDDEDAKDFPEGFAVQLRGAAPAGVLVPFLSIQGSALDSVASSTA